jgi:hypothetical protein
MNIHDDLGSLKQKLKELADVINAFKSESVQLKVLELLLEGKGFELEETGLGKRRQPRRQKPPKKIKKGEDAITKSGSGSKRTGTGRGAWAVVSALVDEGFFKTPRNIRSIIDHCGTHKGHHFKANEISPALLRLLRNEKLSRKKNKDNQYEYSQK